MYKNGLFIFRRDLRIQDNTGLIAAINQCSQVYCIFILDPEQINPAKNAFFSPNAVNFMIESLMELSQKIPLFIAEGNPAQVVKQLIKKLDISLVVFNKDYTPYSVKRDNEIVVAAKGSVVQSYDDSYLNSPHDIKPYKKYTPYYNVASEIPVRRPNYKFGKNLAKLSGSADLHKYLTDASHQPGGRSNGVKLLKSFVKRVGSYANNRDQMGAGATSRLSPHIKFGTISIREIYWSCKTTAFRKELYWRDFYMQIGYHFPHVFGKNFNESRVKWKNDRQMFNKWCMGQTGFDIVDACMKQLNATGYMHNRGRMIVASFLTKILHIDWRWGEKYFANHLTDYDPCSNNGGWQWSAGTGADAQPYFRIFNPERQADSFDNDMSYRIKWLGVDAYNSDGTYKIKPIVDYDSERKKALEYFK